MPVAWQASGTLLGSTGADITPVIPAYAADAIEARVVPASGAPGAEDRAVGWREVEPLV